MTRQALQEYASAIRGRYQKANRHLKGQLLDEFCRTTGFHRKAAIRILNRGPAERRAKPGRPRVYGPQLVPHLVQLWEIADHPCWTEEKALETIQRKLNPVSLSRQIHEMVCRLGEVRAHELPPVIRTR